MLGLTNLTLSQTIQALQNEEISSRELTQAYLDHIERVEPQIRSFITLDPEFAIRETLLGAGRALLITSLVLCTGFFILMAATLHHLVNFGFFTGITILIALVADFVLMPVIMIYMHPKPA